MQRYTECKTEFSVQTKFLETEEIFTDVLGEVATNKLLTAVVERTSSVLSDVIHSRSKQFSVVRTHSVMHARELGPKSLDVVLDIRL